MTKRSDVFCPFSLVSRIRTISAPRASEHLEAVFSSSVARFHPRGLEGDVGGDYYHLGVLGAVWFAGNDLTVALGGDVALCNKK